MQVQKEGSFFVVPCREWMAVHLDRDITFAYRNKRNAVRAANDPKRNLVTSLCFYGQCLYERVAVLETLLLRIKKSTDAYDFDEADAGSIIGDGGSIVGEHSGSEGADRGSRAGVAATEAGDEGTDGGSGGSDGRSS